jgi:tRNA(Ile)-lysidine synthase TilS/MesJ
MNAIFAGKREPWFERLLLRMQAAITQYSMIGREDGILVGLSGGKDSLALLALLSVWNRGVRPLRACYVQNCRFPQSKESLEALGTFCTLLHVPFSIREIEIDVSLGCFPCSHARRKALAEEAVEQGCTRIAIGHTRTDFAQTAILNLARHGTLQGLAPIRQYFENAFAVVRPLIFLDETDIWRIVRRLDLPVQKSSCPIAGTSERAKAATLLKALESMYPKAAANIVRAALDCGISETSSSGAGFLLH